MGELSPTVNSLTDKLCRKGITGCGNGFVRFIGGLPMTAQFHEKLGCKDERTSMFKVRRWGLDGWCRGHPIAMRLREDRSFLGVPAFGLPLYRLLAAIHPYEGVVEFPQSSVCFFPMAWTKEPVIYDIIGDINGHASRLEALFKKMGYERNVRSWYHPERKAIFADEFIDHGPHTQKNRRQHAAFLNQIGEDSDLHEEKIAWLKTLPLYLDLGELLVVHVCWHEGSIHALRPMLDDPQCLNREGLG